MPEYFHPQHRQTESASLDQLVALVRLIDDESSTVRQVVADKLSAVPNDALMLAHSEIVGAIVEEGNDHVRESLVRAASHLTHSHSPDVIAALTFALLSESPAVRDAAIETLVTFGDAAAASAPVVVWLASECTCDNERRSLLASAQTLSSTTHAFTKQFAPDLAFLCGESNSRSVPLKWGELISGDLLFGKNFTLLEDNLKRYTKHGSSLSAEDSAKHWESIAPSVLTACLGRRWEDLSVQGCASVVHAFGACHLQLSGLAQNLCTRLVIAPTDLRILGLISIARVAPQLYGEFEQEFRLLLHSQKPYLQKLALAITIALPTRIFPSQEGGLFDLLVDAYAGADPSFQRDLALRMVNCPPDRLLPWLIREVLSTGAFENQGTLTTVIHESIARVPASKRAELLQQVGQDAITNFPRLSKLIGDLLQ